MIPHDGRACVLDTRLPQMQEFVAERAQDLASRQHGAYDCWVSWEPDLSLSEAKTSVYRQAMRELPHAMQYFEPAWTHFIELLRSGQMRGDVRLLQAREPGGERIYAVGSQKHILCRTGIFLWGVAQQGADSDVLQTIFLVSGACVVWRIWTARRRTHRMLREQMMEEIVTRMKTGPATPEAAVADLVRKYFPSAVRQNLQEVKRILLHQHHVSLGPYGPNNEICFRCLHG